MIIETQYGNFGSFKDLLTFMRLEKKESVFISSCDWWGIECILYQKGFVFTRDDIARIAGQSPL